MKTESWETQPATVSREAGAKQVGEVRTRWAWTEPAVWTDRMLTALERGIKGGVWHRWPNAFFAEHGLFSMEAAYVRIRQSVAR